MMQRLESIRLQFTALMVATFLILPLLGLAGVYLFGKLTPVSLTEIAPQWQYLSLFTLFLVWVGIHFWTFLAPILDWVVKNPGSRIAPLKLRRQIHRFGRDYWGFALLYSLAISLLYFTMATDFWLKEQYVSMATFSALLMTMVILLGLPSYLFALKQLGTLVAFMGLTRVKNTLRSNIMLLSGFVPLLAYTLLLGYHWSTTGELVVASLTLWSAMGIVTLVTAIISTVSLRQALRPVQRALGRSGAVRHEDMARLIPESDDEIGYLTYTLSRVFQRLQDQESHMHAVVNNAAEGIIVTDEYGVVETFNLAAQKLFGCSAPEVRGRPLSWLLPPSSSEEKIVGQSGEHIIEGLHRKGHRIPMSVSVSEWQMSGKRMYTYLLADISDRIAAQEKQRQAEARYRDLVETAHDLVWAMDGQRHWIYLNNACKTIYGLTAEEMLHRPISDFQSPESAEQENEAFTQLLLGKELFQFETVHISSGGCKRHLSFNAKAHKDEKGNVTKITGTARDITEKKAVEEQLTYQAEHDMLTGLYNRRYFQQVLERMVARIGRDGSSGAILYVDLDQFKYINDTLGHAAGDRLLVEISEQLQSHVREGELLARFGGDEFTLLLYNIDETKVLTAADNFRRLFENYRFTDAAQSYRISCSIGASIINRYTSSAEEALSHADLACNIAKSQGRNRVNLYNPGDRDKDGMAEDMGWAARVREMVEKDRIMLAYQPIVSLQKQCIVDYEVLMRMPTDDGQIILPGGFLPAAERFGLIHSIDRWMVQQSIHQLAELNRDRSQNAEPMLRSPIRFCINLSGHAFDDLSLLPTIRSLLDETGLDPSLITFEITESAAITKLTAAKLFISKLKDIGCQFALDDFGSGFCSFTYLKNLPVDKLKIDGAFVKNLSQSTVDQAVVESMNQVAHALGKQTIAECVENGPTLNVLREIGVDCAQGNFLGKPVNHLIKNEALPEFTASILSA